MQMQMQTDIIHDVLSRDGWSWSWLDDDALRAGLLVAATGRGYRAANKTRWERAGGSSALEY